MPWDVRDMHREGDAQVLPGARCFGSCLPRPVVTVHIWRFGRWWCSTAASLRVPCIHGDNGSDGFNERQAGIRNSRAAIRPDRVPHRPWTCSSSSGAGGAGLGHAQLLAGRGVTGWDPLSLHSACFGRTGAVPPFPIPPRATTTLGGFSLGREHLPGRQHHFREVWQ